MSTNAADSGRIRAIARRRVPLDWRRRGRLLLRETPVRLRDLVPDILDRFHEDPLPPPRLRYRVSGTSSRATFLSAGREASENIRDVFEASRQPASRYARWLDFGCGCGRVARHLERTVPIGELWGIDVDEEALRWTASHVRGRYARVAADPPTALPPGHMDVVYAGSVFTHLSEERQLAWLAELHRVMRPGGLLIASTHAPGLSWSRPDLSEDDRQALARRGFVFAAGGGRFNDDSAFHSREYLVATWGRCFGLRHFRENGLNRYQDHSVWEKW